MDKELDKMLERATEISNELGHRFIGTEHFILAALEKEEYYNIFQVKYDNYMSALIKAIGRDKYNRSPKSKSSLLRTAMGDNNIIEEVLVDILMLEEGVGYRLLIDFMNYYDIVNIRSVLDEKADEKNKKIKDTPKYLTNLNEKEYITNPAIGRDIILENIEKTLLKMNKPNVLLVGDAGVGKTAIVEGLAYNIVNGNVNDRLKDKVVMTCSTSSLVAGTRYRGEFEEKVNKLCDYLKNNPNIILFIDEMHTSINAGGAEGAIDMSNILKPYLARGDIKVIGATTLKESEVITKDSAYARRFTTILVEEPTITATNKMIEESIPKFEKFYDLRIDKKLVSTFVNESRDLKGKFPDKCIDLLENVCIDTLYNNEDKITKKDIMRVAEEMNDNQTQLANV